MIRIVPNFTNKTLQMKCLLSLDNGEEDDNEYDYAVLPNKPPQSTGN